MIATRLAYGDALVKLGEASDRVVALDADTKNSTFSLKFKNRWVYNVLLNQLKNIGVYSFKMLLYMVLL